MNRKPHYGEFPEAPHAGRPYQDMPSLTSRSWGRAHRDDDSFGPPDLGGYGDFREAVSAGREQSAAPHGAGHRGRGPRAARTDSAIADDLYDRLTDDELLDASEILLGVDAGVVTLTGEVPIREMKHRAEDHAARVRGVREVHNHIRVDNGMASFGPPGAAVRSHLNQTGSAYRGDSDVR